MKLLSLLETFLNKYVKNKNWKLKRNNFLGDFFWQIVLWWYTMQQNWKYEWYIRQLLADASGMGWKKSWQHFLLLFGQSKCMYLVYFCLVLWHNITNKTGHWKQMSLLVFSYKFAYSHAFSNLMHFYTRHTKSGRVLFYTLRKFWVSVRPSVCPSISASFPDSNLSSFWPIFFKLCMDIDIGEELFGIANGLNSYINNRVMALDWCKNVISGL